MTTTTSSRTAFLSIDELLAVPSSVFRSGRQDVIVTHDLPSPDFGIRCLGDGAEDVASFFSAFDVTEPAARAPEPGRGVLVEGVLFRTSQDDDGEFSEPCFGTPPNFDLPDVTVEISEYEWETDSEYESEEMRKLREEDEQLKREEMERMAEEEALRAQEAVMLAEKEEEARQAARAKADMLDMASEILAEKRVTPTRRISSWTGALPKKGILKSRHSVAPVLAMGATASAIPDDDVDSVDQSGASLNALEEIDYDSASIVSPASRRSSLQSPTSLRTSIASTSYKAQNAATRRVSISVGSQIGGRRLIPMVDYDASPSARPHRPSTTSQADSPHDSRDIGEEPEAEVHPATLQRMRRASRSAPPGRNEKGTIIRQSLDSGFEVVLDPSVSKPGTVNCGIQCIGEEIDAEIKIMHSEEVGHDSDQETDEILPQKSNSLDDDENMEMSPKTPGVGKPMAIENNPETASKIRFADQPYTVETPGQTITFATTKSVITEGDDASAADTEKDNRLVDGGEIVVIELPKTPAKPSTDGDEDTATGEESTPTEKGSDASAPLSVQKSIQVEIAQCPDRVTPLKKRKSLINPPVDRSAPRLSGKALDVAQALDFNEAPTSNPRLSSRKRKLSVRMPLPFVLEDDAVFQAGVLPLEIPQLKKKTKRSAKPALVYKGKSILTDVVALEIMPSHFEENSEAHHQHYYRIGDVHHAVDLDASPVIEPSKIAVNDDELSDRPNVVDVDGSRHARSQSKSENSQGIRQSRRRTSKSSIAIERNSTTLKRNTNAKRGSSKMEAEKDYQSVNSSNPSGRMSSGKDTDVSIPDYNDEDYGDDDDNADFDFPVDDVDVEEIEPAAAEHQQRSTRSVSESVPSALADEIESVVPERPQKSRQSTRSTRSARSEHSVATASTSTTAVPTARRTRTRGAQRKANVNRELRNLAAVPIPREELEEKPAVRRSKRQRFPRLEYYNNEKVVYERRASQVLPTIAQIVVAISDDDASESSTASWLARGKISRQPADRQVSDTTSSRQPATRRREPRKRKRQ